MCTPLVSKIDSSPLLMLEKNVLIEFVIHWGNWMNIPKSEILDESSS